MYLTALTQDVDLQHSLSKTHMTLFDWSQGKSSVVLLIINEQHELLPDQNFAISRDFCEEPVTVLCKIPTYGLGDRHLKEAAKVISDIGCHVVFVSPIPYLILLLSHWGNNLVGVMHNGYRDKYEKDGKITYTVSQEGWQCLTW